MNIDQLLRDTAPDTEALRTHARQLRSQVIADFNESKDSSYRAGRKMSRRRSTGLVASGALAAVLGVGGVAYATGTLPMPDVFSDAITATDFVKDDPDMSQMVDLALPDGGRFAVWRGQSSTAFCEASTDYSDPSHTEDGTLGAVSCTDDIGDSAVAEYNRIKLNWAAGKHASNADSATWYPVIYGDTTAIPAALNATQVRISGTYVQTGQPVDLTVDVDSVTRAFAAVLPGSSINPWTNAGEYRLADPSGLTLTFTDAQGTVLDTRSVPL